MAERERRTGKLIHGPHGELYQHHNVMIEHFEQSIIAKLAKDYGMDENHVISKIVKQWVSEHCVLEDHLEEFVNITLQRAKKYGES